MLDLFQYDFMQRALLAMVAMSLFSPVLGIFLMRVSLLDFFLGSLRRSRL